MTIIYIYDNKPNELLFSFMIQICLKFQKNNEKQLKKLFFRYPRRKKRIYENKKNKEAGKKI